MIEKVKPFGYKAYGSIPHLPNSRAGERDFSADNRMVEIATKKPRDKYDCVIVQEKLDGSNCTVAKINGKILALGRAGYRAETSGFEQHRLFAWWVAHRKGIFYDLLNEGERIVGEWLAQAHGTIYKLNHSPYVVFDIMTKHERIPFSRFIRRTAGCGLDIPYLLHSGAPVSVENVLEILGEHGYHGAVGKAEGAVWRVQNEKPTGIRGERKWRVDFLVKYVRPEKVDGYYLPEQNGGDTVWNWYPDKDSGWFEHPLRFNPMQEFSYEV